MRSFEVWGDSHLDDMEGIGARKALEYQLHFRNDVNMVRNMAKAGSQVKDWMDDCLHSTRAEVVVISSGFNEAVAVETGWNGQTKRQVYSDWRFLIGALRKAGSEVLWVPTQYKHKWAKTEFPLTEEFHILPACFGAELLEWDPREEDICPDNVHHTYEASSRLATAILDSISKEEKEEDEDLSGVSGGAGVDGDLSGGGDEEPSSS